MWYCFWFAIAPRINGENPPGEAELASPVGRYESQAAPLKTPHWPV